MISTTRDETYPQAMDLPKANLLKRWGASLLDEGAIKLIVGLLGGVFSAGLLWLISIAAFICQDMPFGHGQSVGRKITDQVLVNREGVPCSHVESAQRNALRVLLWYLSFGMLALVDVALVLFHPKGLTTADMIVGTQVVDKAYALPRAE
jgi:uncharacterized RDD family membrane protein YckC